MNRIVKYAVAVTLAGACAVAISAPSQAHRWHHHHWHNGMAIGAGIAAGALIGAAAANSAYYGPDYSYGPSYAYPPGYGAYDYAPGYLGRNSTACTQSPASPDYVSCQNAR